MGGPGKSKEWSHISERRVGVHQAEDGQFGRKDGKSRILQLGKASEFGNSE